MSGWRIQRVVVEVHLGVERQQIAALGDDERVDLEQRRVGRDERLVERQHHLGRLADLRVGEADGKRQLARLVRLQPNRRDR